MEEWKDGVGANEAEDSFAMESNEIEQSKVSIMRALVEVEDPSAKVPSFFSQSYVSFSFFFFFGVFSSPFSFSSPSACLLVKLLLLLLSFLFWS